MKIDLSFLTSDDWESIKKDLFNDIEKQKIKKIKERKNENKQNDQNRKSKRNIVGF